jgi:hypothetical protein
VIQEFADDPHGAEFSAHGTGRGSGFPLFPDGVEFPGVYGERFLPFPI